MNDLSTHVMSNIEAQPTAATLQAVDDGWVLTMSRDFPHPVEEVWRMITEPEFLQLWSPVVPDRSLTHVGPATSHETPEAPAVDVEVLESTPPRVLVHRWGPHTLRWTIEATATGCRLTLAHTFQETGEQGMYGAGWHLCFAVLRAVLDGHLVERVVGARADEYGWSALRERYDAELPMG